MTEAPERIWIIPCTAFDVDWQEGHYTAIEQPSRAEYVRADLPAAVTVKPLEWWVDADGNFLAKSPFGEYCAYYDESYGWLCMVDGHDDSWAKYPYGDDGFETEGAAKAECERDYLSRMTPFVEATQPDPYRVLARHQPCGCIICQCEDEEQCHGCGAKTCGTHPVGNIPDPVFADPREPDPVKDAARVLLAALEDMPWDATCFERHDEKFLDGGHAQISEFLRALAEQEQSE